ncbi:hypothetical protein BC828DRAFT_164919 [Blastocladiella britannica]|nr:hypothetical protein BC828DRAFT_164919 [Blastocladiella britannica]
MHPMTARSKPLASFDPRPVRSQCRSCLLVPLLPCVSLSHLLRASLDHPRFGTMPKTPPLFVCLGIPPFTQLHSIADAPTFCDRCTRLPNLFLPEYPTLPQSHDSPLPSKRMAPHLFVTTAFLPSQFFSTLASRPPFQGTMSRSPNDSCPRPLP